MSIFGDCCIWLTNISSNNQNIYLLKLCVCQEKTSHIVTR